MNSFKYINSCLSIYTILSAEYDKFDDSSFTISNGKLTHYFLKEKNKCCQDNGRKLFYYCGPKQLRHSDLV